jgi:hypothetical protein
MNELTDIEIEQVNGGIFGFAAVQLFNVAAWVVTFID